MGSLLLPIDSFYFRRLMENDKSILREEKEKSLWFIELFRRALPISDSIDEAMMAAELAFSVNSNPQSKSGHIVREKIAPVDAKFAYDIENRKAQSILNRTIAASKKMTASARRDLERALSVNNRDDLAKSLQRFIDRYRLQLADILATSQMASLLAGSQEVAKSIPVVPMFPSALPPATLEPAKAVALIERLQQMQVSEREQAIYELPSDQQQFARQGLLAMQQGGAEPPGPFIPSSSADVPPEKIHYPIIDEAARSLAEKNVMSRHQFDGLDAALRQRAFTIASVESDETIAKIRDTITESIQNGVDLATFREAVLSTVDAGTFMSDAHLETVYRTAVQTAFSDGQMMVLQHPFVRSGFPYATYDAIRDSRVRHNHLALETLGIQGTNVYRIDDPVFQLFRPPWDYCDRCSWTPITARQAAARGIDEAARWLETGIDPSPPAFVPMPSFRPPPGFQRSISGAFSFDESSVNRDESGRFAEQAKSMEHGSLKHIGGLPVRRKSNPKHAAIDKMAKEWKKDISEADHPYIDKISARIKKSGLGPLSFSDEAAESGIWAPGSVIAKAMENIFTDYEKGKFGDIDDETGEYRIDTDSGHVAGDADAVVKHIMEDRAKRAMHGKKRDAALKRADGLVEADAFEDPDRSRKDWEGFADLPKGAKVVSLEPNTYGRVGVISKDENGVNEVILEGTGEVGGTFVEPLDEKLSWRAEKKASKQSESESLFADEKAKPKKRAKAKRAAEKLTPVTEEETADFFAVKPEQGRLFSVDDGKGQWITIGGTKGESGKRHGGSPVFVVDGKITKGNPKLTGKKLGQLDSEKADDDKSTHRQQLHREKQYQKAIWGKKARKLGLDPDSLHQLADQMKEHNNAHIADVTSMLKQTRESAKKLGINVHHAHKAFEGGDETEIKGFDLLARQMAGEYPHLLGAHGYETDKEADANEGEAVVKLFEYLRQGNPEAMSVEDSYEQALDYMMERKSAEPVEELEEAPFST